MQRRLGGMGALDEYRLVVAGLRCYWQRVPRCVAVQISGRKRRFAVSGLLHHVVLRPAIHITIDLLCFSKRERPNSASFQSWYVCCVLHSCGWHLGRGLLGCVGGRS